MSQEHESGNTYDYSWVQRERCPSCGHDTASTPERDLPAALVDAGRSWQQFLSTVSDHPGGREDLRWRPGPRRWSAIEYGCHTRDVLALFARRMELTLLMEEPTLECWDPDELAEAIFYREQDPHAVADDVERAAVELATLLQPLPLADLERLASAHGAAFTVAGLGRCGLHEALHHLRDAQTVVPATS